MYRIHRLVLVCGLALSVPPAAHGQSMEELFDQLFVFGEGNEPLHLTGSAGVPATQLHGSHFIPDQSASNASLLDFIASSIAGNVSNFPLPSTVSSQTFKIVDGVPTPTSTSFGPILAERAQTIGKGRLNAGANYSRLNFSSIRGVSTRDIGLTFIHTNVDFEGCDEALGADCTDFGIPQVENDLIALTLDLRMDAEVMAFYSTFGLTDWLDMSLAIPIVNFSMRGSSLAQITPSTPEAALHFFGGTPDNPTLEARSAAIDGSTTGLGDVSLRLKARVTNNEKWNFGLLGEARAPTGRQEDFLGTGDWNLRALAIVSGELDNFSPHVNLGYQYRGSDLEQDLVEIVAGFDFLMADWVTLAVDLLGGFRMGESTLEFPEPVQIVAPFRRTVTRTNLPDLRDDVVDGSFGFKFRTGGGVLILANVLVALNDGGLRPDWAPTLGIEYLF